MLLSIEGAPRVSTDAGILQLDISKRPESMSQKVHFQSNLGESKIKTALFSRTYKVNLTPFITKFLSSILKTFFKGLASLFDFFKVRSANTLKIVGGLFNY